MTLQHAGDLRRLESRHEQTIAYGEPSPAPRIQFADGWRLPALALLGAGGIVCSLPTLLRRPLASMETSTFSLGCWWVLGLAALLRRDRVAPPRVRLALAAFGFLGGVLSSGAVLQPLLHLPRRPTWPYTAMAHLAELFFVLLALVIVRPPARSGDAAGRGPSAPRWMLAALALGAAGTLLDAVTGHAMCGFVLAVAAPSTLVLGLLVRYWRRAVATGAAGLVTVLLALGDVVWALPLVVLPRYLLGEPWPAYELVWGRVTGLVWGVCVGLYVLEGVAPRLLRRWSLAPKP